MNLSDINAIISEARSSRDLSCPEEMKRASEYQDEVDNCVNFALAYLRGAFEGMIDPTSPRAFAELESALWRAVSKANSYPVHLCMRYSEASPNEDHLEFVNAFEVRSGDTSSLAALLLFLDALAEVDEFLLSRSALVLAELSRSCVPD